MLPWIYFEIAAIGLAILMSAVAGAMMQGFHLL
jgi:hypothetical protein